MSIKGEGNHEADQEYRERTAEFMEHKNVDEAAEEAKQAVDDDDEGPKLEEARKKTADVADYDKA